VAVLRNEFVLVYLSDGARCQQSNKVGDHCTAHQQEPFAHAGLAVEDVDHSVLVDHSFVKLDPQTDGSNAKDGSKEGGKHECNLPCLAESNNEEGHDRTERAHDHREHRAVTFAERQVLEVLERWLEVACAASEAIRSFAGCSGGIAGLQARCQHSFSRRTKPIHGSVCACAVPDGPEGDSASFTFLEDIGAKGLRRIA